MNKIDKLRILKFLVLAKEDPMYFLQNYAMVQHPSKGPIPFVPESHQLEYITALMSGDNTIVRGARQVGMTITTLMYILTYALLNNDKEILLTAKTLYQARDNLDRIRYAHHFLPKPLKEIFDMVENNKQYISFSNGTRIQASALHPSIGRGLSLDLLHIDNAYNIDRFQLEEVWCSLYPCMASRKNAQAIITSTNGFNGIFRDIYNNAKAGDNNFTAIDIIRP